MSSLLQTVTDRGFDAVVGTSTVPVLVEFWKPGCGHCRALMKELELLQEECGGQLLIVRMNVEEQFQIAAELEISSLPALALYKNGEFMTFIGGLGKKEAIRTQVESVLYG
jgi:thioredoxin 1